MSDDRIIDGEVWTHPARAQEEALTAPWHEVLHHPPARRGNVTPLPRPDLDWSTRRDRRAEQVWRSRSGADDVTPWGRSDDRLMQAAEGHLDAAGDRAEALRCAPGARSAGHVEQADTYMRRAHRLVVALQRRQDSGGMSRVERDRAADELDRLAEMARALPSLPKNQPAARDTESSPSPQARRLAGVTRDQAEARLADVVARIGEVPDGLALSRLAAEVGPLVAVQLLDWQATRDRLVAGAEDAGLSRRLDEVERPIRLGLLRGVEQVSRDDFVAVLQARGL